VPEKTKRIGRLHVITDTRPGRDALSVVAAALSAGADTVQVRVEDDCTDRDAFSLAGRMLALCAPYGVLCLVNDRVDVALAAGADGVHVGADDLPVAVVRRLLGPLAVVGATARDPETARRAVDDGASYLGCGPAFATSTKDGLPDPIGPSGVAAVAGAVDVPVVAIGGIRVERIAELTRAGASGVAVVGALSSAPDPAAATRALLWALR